MENEELLTPIKPTIRCTNVPLKLLEKKAAKEYFSQFGRIMRLGLKTKIKACTVQYDSHEAAEFAVVNAGSYEGETFPVMLEMKKKRPKKEVDPDWRMDPEVRAELEAMSDEFSTKRKYNLRPEGMILDAEPPPALKKERKMKRLRKSDKPVIAVTKPISAISADKQELLTKLKQPAITVEEKFRTLDVRDKLIRLIRAQKQIDISKTKHTVGTCPDMCPEKERLMREVQHQVALYEQESSERTMNHSVAVKQYSRSSADQEAPLPHELRNVDVLQMTMGYLMHRILNLCDSPDTNLAEWFHFLWDRTRGIRKDITQQELCCQGSVELVEQCARFHIHCSARLVAEDSSVFDQKINTENLTKCLQTLKYMYHDLALKGEQCPHEQEFRAYIILLNLNDGNFMWEVQQLRSEIQKSKEIKFALEVYSALDKNNYVKFFKLVQATTYLNACILLRYFVQVRTRAISTILKCYAPRAPHTQFPLQEFNKILAFEGTNATADFLEYFGLSINEEQTHVILDKRQYSLPDYPYMLDRAIEVIESKRQTSVGEIVCGKPLPPPVFIQHVVQSSFDEGGYLDLSEFTEEFMQDTEPVKETVEVKSVVPPYLFKERSNSPLMMDAGEVVKQPWLKKPEITTSIFAKSDAASKPVVEPSKIFSSITAQIGKKTFPHPLQPSPFAQVNIFPNAKQQIFPTVTENIKKPLDHTDAPQKKVGGFQFDLGDSQAELEKLKEKRLEEERRQKEKEVQLQREKEMRHMAEVARKKQEKEKLEEEQRRQLENKHRELQELERMRKLEELKKEEQKIREERKKLEEQMVMSLQITQAVRSLMDDMLVEVEDDYRKHRLEFLKQNTIKRLVVARWKKKIATNKRKRKAVDQSPVWLSSKSSKETASDLYSKTQDITLILRKRYKQGLSRDVLPKTVEEVKKIDLVALTGKSLIKNLNPVQKYVYWKINISIAESAEMKISELVETTLDGYLGWKDSHGLKFLLEQHPFESNQITYCLQQLASKEMDSDADGFIFVSHHISDSLLRRIYQLINRLEEYAAVPILLILQKYPEDTSKLDELVDKGLISNYEIQTGPFNRIKCLQYFNEGLIFLAENLNHKQPLELNTLRSFLMQHLGTELWRRISSFAKWNFAYKQCLTVPNVAIGLYNEAVEFIKQSVFSEECYKYPKFPAIFRDFLPSKIPDALPCDYKYFPSFWRNPRYGKYVLNIIDSLTLPKFQSTWPPNNQATLEKLIFNYCSKIFDKPQRVFYKIMASILRDVDIDRFDTILWTSIVEAIALEKINDVNFDLTDKTFSSNTVFNQLFVIYESSVVNKYCRDPWFYLNNPAIQEELDESLNEPEGGEIKVPDEDYEIDLEKTFEEASTREVPEIAAYTSQLNNIHTLMEDLEESMAIQREINRKFQSSLQKVLDDI